MKSLGFLSPLDAFPSTWPVLQLRLQEGARVEGRVVGRVGRVAPARGVALGHEVLPELDGAWLRGGGVGAGTGTGRGWG